VFSPPLLSLNKHTPAQLHELQHYALTPNHFVVKNGRIVETFGTTAKQNITEGDIKSNLEHSLFRFTALIFLQFSSKKYF